MDNSESDLVTGIKNDYINYTENSQIVSFASSM